MPWVPMGPTADRFFGSLLSNTPNCWRSCHLLQDRAGDFPLVLVDEVAAIARRHTRLLLFVFANLADRQRSLFTDLHGNCVSGSAERVMHHDEREGPLGCDLAHRVTWADFFEHGHVALSRQEPDEVAVAVTGISGQEQHAGFLSLSHWTSP